MSSRSVREWFREQLVSRVPSIVFHETLNTLPANGGRITDPVWMTLEFDPADELRISLGVRGLFRESGEVVVVVAARSGRGDSEVVNACELVRAAFQEVRVRINVAPPGQPEVDGHLRIESVGVPNTNSTEDGNWFLGSVSCAYSLDVVRGPV